MLSYSALVLGVCAPIKVAARISGGRPPTLSILRIFASELKITRFGVISALSRGTERGPERRALPRTAGSLAASRHLKGVVRVAAGDVARVVGVCDSVVKEIHGGGSCGVSWTLLYWYFQNKICFFKIIKAH